MNAVMHPDRDIVHQIEELFDQFGHGHYDGARAEPVSARAHALQCAQLAEWADAPETLVVAALLHDIGHFIAPDAAIDAIDDVHELRALGFLASSFGADVIEPIRLHVQASASSSRWTRRMRRRCRRRRCSPCSCRAARCRPTRSTSSPRCRTPRKRCRCGVGTIWRTPGRMTPSLHYYLMFVEAVRTRPFEAPRTVIGAATCPDSAVTGLSRPRLSVESAETNTQKNLPAQP